MLLSLSSLFLVILVILWNWNTFKHLKLPVDIPCFWLNFFLLKKFFFFIKEGEILDNVVGSLG